VARERIAALHERRPRHAADSARIPAVQIVNRQQELLVLSMRPWVLAREAGILFEEVQLKFDESSGGLKVADIERYGVAGKVPVLVIDGEPVWDSLRHLRDARERFPEKQLWPSDARARQVARSICAEMHSGFQALRAACDEYSLEPSGQGHECNSRRDIDRVVGIWKSCRERFGKGGPLLSVASRSPTPISHRW